MAASWEASDSTRSLKRDAARAARHCHRRLPDHAESRARFTTLASVVSSHQWVVGHRGAATHVIAHRHREIVSSGTPYPARVWEPEYSLSDAGAPVDSKLKRQSSSVWVDLFVVHGCMSRLDWQLAASPTSIDESGTDYLYRVDYTHSLMSQRPFAIAVVERPLCCSERACQSRHANDGFGRSAGIPGSA